MIEGVAAERIAARAGTPVFAYAASGLRGRVAEFERAFAAISPRVCYAVKACGNVHVLRQLGMAGCWMDVVSGGELERTFLAGVPLDRVVFAGVGKQRHEIRAALSGRCSLLWETLDRSSQRLAAERGAVHAFNVESEQELDAIATEAARLKVRARCHLRVNPDVDARTHRYITTGTRQNKFGVAIDQAERIFKAWRGKKWIDLCGLHAHIGSMIQSPRPYVRCVKALLEVTDRLEKAGMRVEMLDLGGGFGVDYVDGQSVEIGEYARALVPLLKERVEGGLQIALEPGRWIAAGSGVLLVRVLYTKRHGETRFAVVDAGMNALIRPALYEAFHFVWPVRVRRGMVPRGMVVEAENKGLLRQSVVGPICESGDFLALDRALPELRPGDVVAVFHAGAYGMSMASTYNDQPKPAEVLVDGKKMMLVREREPLIDQMRAELAARML
jgi:diaminopimelate decarboxylase